MDRTRNTYFLGFHGIAAFLAISVCLLPTGMIKAQNPSFAGEEFRRVYTYDTIPEGASGTPTVHEVFLADSGVFFISNFKPQGVFYAYSNNLQLVAGSEQEAFSSAARWVFLGLSDPETVMFIPTNFGNPYPAYSFGPGGLAALSEPTPEQGFNMGNYFDGRMMYITIEGAGVGPKIWYYQKGQPAQLLMDRSTVENLNTLVDYDGESFVYVTGDPGVDLAVWMQKPDGSRTRIIGYGESLPGTDGTYRGMVTTGSVYVDQGKVYIRGETNETLPVWTAKSFFWSDGTNIELIATTGMQIPGHEGAVIDGFEVFNVTDGISWLTVSQTNGLKVIYQVEENIWRKVLSSADQLDGRAPVALNIFPHGMRDNTVAVLASFLQPNFTIASELYVNRELPGLDGNSGGTGGVAVSIERNPDGSWKLSLPAEAGRTYTLQSAGNLADWGNEGEPIIAEIAGMVEWIVDGEANENFFRVLVE